MGIIKIKKTRGISKEKQIPMFQQDDRQKEFSVMSKGLGKSYLTPQAINWHKNKLEERMYLPLKDGKKASMPRYYKDKMYKDGEKFMISIHMKQLAEKQTDDLLKEIGIENFDFHIVQRHLNQFRRNKKQSSQRPNIAKHCQHCQTLPTLPRLPNISKQLNRHGA